MLSLTKWTEDTELRNNAGAASFVEKGLSCEWAAALYAAVSDGALFSTIKADDSVVQESHVEHMYGTAEVLSQLVLSCLILPPQVVMTCQRLRARCPAALIQQWALVSQIEMKELSPSV